MPFDLSKISPTLAAIFGDRPHEDYTFCPWVLEMDESVLRKIAAELRESWERRVGECVWLIGNSHDGQAQATCIERIVHYEREYKACPYCGKKIKEASNG